MSLAEKLKDAGADTIGARFTAACTEAIRQHPNSARDAWHSVGATFGHEFIRGIMNDMQPKTQAAQTLAIVPKQTVAAIVPKPYKPNAISPERLERRREFAVTIRSKYKNSGGICWSDVSWHELHGLKRDGNEAKALLAAGPANTPNDSRSVGEILGIKRVDEIIGGIRNASPR